MAEHEPFRCCGQVAKDNWRKIVITLTTLESNLASCRQSGSDPKLAFQADPVPAFAM